MAILLWMSAGGLIAGLALLRKVPVAPPRHTFESDQLRVSVIIPARNEESNLPQLLESLRSSASPFLQVIVVDDSSTDATAAVARTYGATVIDAGPLPKGWMGKTWACHQGTLTATGEALFFLDADTQFVPEGYARIIEYFAKLSQNTALSLLPFHRTQCWYEELSLFFNLLMAMGAGGFGKLDPPHLFGQAVLIRKDLYERAGGHLSVQGEILENVRFSAYVRAAGGKICTLGGRGALQMRMFPHGIGQLRESWQKGFAAAAGLTSPLVLALSVYWLSTAMSTAILLFVFRGSMWLAVAVLYLLNVLQIASYARQLGSFRWTTAWLYPIALSFYFVVFGQSLWRQRLGKSVTWKGRRLWN